MSLDVNEPRTGERSGRLPRGRHTLTREQVLDSQRERLLEAMLDLVAERGYAATTVADVVGSARVSRNAFYELFVDKEDCFLAVSEQIGEELLLLMYAQASAPSWIEATRAGMRVYLEHWVERPEFARTYLLELGAAGARGQAQRDRVYTRFGAMFEALAGWARLAQPGLAPLPRLAPRILVIAITELIAQEVREGRGAQLVELEPELSAFVIRTIADDATARSAV